MISISIVTAVHNEQKYLPLTLPRMQDRRVGEYVFVLDRCSDQSEEIIQDWCKNEGLQHKVKIFHYVSGKWVWRNAEVYNYAFSQATGDIIVKNDADVLFDRNALGMLDFDGKTGAICFGSENPTKNRKLEQFLLKRYVLPTKVMRFLFTKRRTRDKKRLSYWNKSCFFGTPRELFRRFGFLDSPTGDCNSYLIRIEQSGYKVRYNGQTRMIHLGGGRNLFIARARRGCVIRELEDDSVSFWIALWYTFNLPSPLILMGYLFGDRYIYRYRNRLEDAN